jgi:STE24 endopeptidase
MNAYAWIILVALLVEYGLNLVGNRLNLSSLQLALPDEFRGSFDDERYTKSQDYTRTKTRFSMVMASFDLALLLVFWLSGGFAWLDTWARGLGFGPLGSGLSFIGLLALGSRLIGLTSTLYATFAIEERFGFNRTTLSTFWQDQVKSLVLTVLLGGPLLAAILWLFNSLGEGAWLWCWAVTTLFTLVGMFLAPTWIMPLFNKFTPIEEGELKDAILAYARSVSFPLEGIFVIDGSKRSSKANAFFTGFGKSKRIALFDTLIEGQSTAELVAVVAHEIGHYKRKHILKSLAIGIAHFGVLFWMLSYFLQTPELFEAFGLDVSGTEGLPVYAGLLFFGLLLTPIELVLSVLMSAFSRKNEFEADAFAAQTTACAEDLISALKKLSLENLSNLTPHPFYVWLHHTHPPILARIAALRS